MRSVRRRNADHIFRSQKLGAGGKHNIGLIMAESYNRKTGTRSRPYYTVNPVAKDLGLKVDTSCERDDAQCVRRVVKAFAKTSDKDVLICWVRLRC